MPDPDENLEMVDYAIDMLTAELPLIEEEYGWTPALQDEVLGVLRKARDEMASGSAPGGLGLLARLDKAGVKEGGLREFCGMLDGALG